jgi:hypothetical protein
MNGADCNYRSKEAMLHRNANITADGQKFPPYVEFKWRKMVKEKFLREL